LMPATGMAGGWGAPDFLRKLGGEAGDLVLVPEADLRGFAAGATILERPRKGGKVRGVLFRPRRRATLPGDLRRFRALIEEDGFLWVVIPKKTAMKPLGRDVTFQDVLDIALRTDLVDNKTLTFSETEYGVRLVVRKHLRRGAGGPATVDVSMEVSSIILNQRIPAMRSQNTFGASTADVSE